ncbi:MAG: two-component regulator propeller domain-containing protein [Candidatus Gracilibacteria bacterium]|nr:two-component regulator propeller domain-containing protein [Candidatus Gracilibacteria bacterium]
MKNINKKGISVIELIIVITVIAILSVISLLSYKSYLVSVRDSSRLVELQNIETGLGSYVIRSGFYPDPTNGVNITYSGSELWKQGTFGDDVSNLVGYSKGVYDPLTKNQYTYSLKNSRREYSIAGVLEERPGLVAYNKLHSQVSAAEKGKTKGIAIVKGNYNGELISIQLNGLTYVLALPSIVSSDLSSLDIVDILNNNNLVYNDYGNIPASYSGTKYSFDENIDFAPNNLLLYSGIVSDLRETYNQVGLLQNVRLAYSGSILGKSISVNRLDDTDLFSPEPSNKIKILACDLINFKLKYFVECGKVDFLTFFVVNVLNIDISNLPGNQITAVYQDDDGNFVFGTNNGIAFFDGINWVVYKKQDSGLVLNHITSVNQDNNGDYWIGTSNGINKLVLGDFVDKSDDVWFTYNKTILKNSHIQYIYTDSNGVVWIGTNQGATSYNGEVWTDYTRKSSGITHNNITAIYNDSAGYVWFGTNSKGVDRYKMSDGTVENYNAGNLPNHIVKYIFEDSNSKVWVGTQGGIGITSNSGTSWTTYTTANTSGGLINNNITYLFEDSSGNIRVGTTGGVSKFNGSSWTNYDTGDGLLGNYVFLITEDDNGNILIFTNGGLDTIDASGNIIT